MEQKITIVSESFKNFLNTGHICIAFTDEGQADCFADLVEQETDKEVFVDQIPLNPENWDQFIL